MSDNRSWSFPVDQNEGINKLATQGESSVVLAADVLRLGGAGRPQRPSSEPHKSPFVIKDAGSNNGPPPFVISENAPKQPERPTQVPAETPVSPPRAGGLSRLPTLYGLEARPAEQLSAKSELQSLKDKIQQEATAAGLSSAQWRAKLEDFERTADNNGISAADRTEFYRHISRLLTTPGALGAAERCRLASEILRNAAYPQKIDQGNHNTCNITSLETRLYTRAPQHPARVVADIAINGAFRAADGTVIRLNNLAPDSEAQLVPTPDGKRNYASQLFQMAGANIYWQRKEFLPNGRRAGTGNIEYCQDLTPDGSTGEYLLDRSKNPAQKYVDSMEKQSCQPFLDMQELATINEQIVGKRENDFAIIGEKSSTVGIIGVESIDQLRENLQRLKNERKFPILLRVDVRQAPFGNGTGSYAPHALTITDYDPATGSVTVDNQWGSSNDRTGLPGQLPRLTVQELFNAMQDRQERKNVFEEIGKKWKEASTDDLLYTAKTAGTSRLLACGVFGSTPALLHGGLNQGLKSLGADGLAAAGESRLGSALFRNGIRLGALGAAAYIHDIPGAFQESTGYGVAKLARVGLDATMFEAGYYVLNTVGPKWAPGRYGLAIGGALAFATAYDLSLGKIFEDCLTRVLAPNR